MDKIHAKRIGYLCTVAILGVLLFIYPAIAQQQNCTTFNAPISFNYSIELRNQTTTGNLIDYATCDITVFRSTINDSRMIDNDDGTYTCPILVDFPTGKYATNITCDQGGLEAVMKGNFEVIPDDVPISIIGFLLGISALFIFYSVKLEDRFSAIKLFMLLLTLLTFFVIFFITFPLIKEEGAGANLIDFAERTFIVYTYLFTFLVFYFVVRWILQILAMFTQKRKKKAEKGAVF